VSVLYKNSVHTKQLTHIVPVYECQSGSAGEAKSRCLSREPYKRHKCTLWVQWRLF